MHQTPEGYLVCLDVAIARTGMQEYLEEEIPDVTPGASGTVLVYRLPEEVFAPATVASFEGKSVTLDHPEEFITPQSWRELTVGVAQNVRRGAAGTKQAEDLLLADLLITDAKAIQAVQDGLREVSCGYEADYVEMSKGVGKQVNITGNHIALVEKSRCGARCSIKDSIQKPIKRPENKEIFMAKASSRAPSVKSGFFDRLLGHPKVQRAMDEAVAEEAKKEQQDDETAKPDEPEVKDGDALAELSAKIDELTLMVRGLLEGKAPTDDDDPVKDDDTVDDDGTVEDEDAVQDEDGPAKAQDRALRRKTADADTVRRSRLLAPELRARVGDPYDAGVIFIFTL